MRKSRIKFMNIKYKLNDDIDIFNIKEDINLKVNFPNLQEIYVGNVKEEINFYKKLIQNNKDIKMTLYFLTFENTQKFKKYRNITVLFANNKNINDFLLNMNL